MNCTKLCAGVCSVALVLMTACGGGESSPAPSVVVVPPSWSTWLPSTPPPDSQGLDIARVRIFADRRGGVVLVGRVVQGTVASYRSWRYRRDGGWSASTVLLTQSADEPAPLAVSEIYESASGAVLALSNNAGQLRTLSFTHERGWTDMSLPPLGSAGSTAPELSATKDGTVIATTMSGTPTTGSILRTFTWNGATWLPRNTYIVPASSDYTPPQGSVMWGWASARLFETAAGPIVSAQYTFTPPPSTQYRVAILKADSSDPSKLTVQRQCDYPGVGCNGLFGVLLTGDLVRWNGQSSFATGYTRETKGTLVMNVGLPTELGSIRPLFAHSDAGDLFVTRCVEIHAFCEESQSVTWVDALTGTRRKAIGTFFGAMTVSGGVFVFRVSDSASAVPSNSWKVSYRLGVAEYTEPVIYGAQPDADVKQVIDSGGNDQFVLLSRNRGDGVLEVNIDSRIRR